MVGEQGRIWAKGYQEGRLQCQLYPDVVPALQQWQDLGTRVYSFSSGSRLAQRDLFSHTSQGDVRRYLSGYFDTTSGSKVGHPVASAFEDRANPRMHPSVFVLGGTDFYDSLDLKCPVAVMVHGVHVLACRPLFGEGLKRTLISWFSSQDNSCSSAIFGAG